MFQILPRSFQKNWLGREASPCQWFWCVLYHKDMDTKPEC